MCLWGIQRCVSETLPLAEEKREGGGSEAEKRFAYLKSASDFRPL